MRVNEWRCAMALREIKAQRVAAPGSALIDCTERGVAKTRTGGGYGIRCCRAQPGEMYMRQPLRAQDVAPMPCVGARMVVGQA